MQVPQTRYSYDRSRPGTRDPRCPHCYRPTNTLLLDPTTAPVQGPPTLPTLPSSCRRSACTTGHHTALHGTSWPVGNALVCRPSGNGFDSLHGRRTVFIILLLLVVCLLLLLFCFVCCFSPFFRSAKATNYYCLCGAALGTLRTDTRAVWVVPVIVYAAGITGGAHPAMSTFGQRWPNAQWHGSTPLTHNDSRRDQN